ncbi:MAG: MFS transporter [Ignavibacteriae bacterium]|nr:MFS transporter [Ignavibacteriota bacterium]
MNFNSKAFNALKISEFRNYTLARLFITLGTQMQAVIVGWQIYQITKDPFSLGLIGLAEAIPSILTALISGHIVDTSDRKKILMSSFILMFFCSSSLLFISTDIVSFVTDYKVISIYSIIFISGIARGFSMPSAFALLGQIIPKDLYPNAISWNTTTWQIGAVAGPAIGGLMYGYFGVTISYISVVSMAFIAILLISTISKKTVPDITGGNTLKERLSAGIKFVFANKIILSAMSLDMFAVLFGGAVAMLPVYAGEILSAGAEGLGMLRAAPSVGAVLMALFLTHKPPTSNAGRNLLLCVAGFGLCIIGFGLSHSFILSLLLLALSGMFDSVSVVIRQTIIQLKTPENMKGRVSAVNSIFIGSSNEIGAFESGLAAKIMGVVPSVIFGGLMTLVVVTVVFFASPSLRKLKL